MALQNYSLLPMGEFLAKTYYIPDYQREYSWEKDEWEAFWDDLDRAKDSSAEAQHFFGQVVVHNDGDGKEPRKYIIDGQQRTVTSVLFLRAMKWSIDRIPGTSENEDAQEISDEIIHSIGRYTSKANKLHLILGEQDRDYFQEHIQRQYPDEDVKEKKKSRERMRKGFIFFRDKIQNALSGCGMNSQDCIDCLSSYYEAFANRFTILYMEATKEEEAFAIFETLNARGKDLKTADLLKNYIFRKSKDVAWCKKTWNSMITILDDADPTKYIRYFWNSRYSFIRDKDLFREIGRKEDFKGPRGIKNLLELLEKYAPYYRAMVVPGDSDDATFQNRELNQSLRALKTLKARSFYPVILAMEQAEFDEAEVAVVAGQIERFIFRNLTICGRATGQIERLFADTARKIYTGELDNIEDICSRIREQMVTDEEFQGALVIWSASKSENEIVRYILTKIHRLLDKNMELNNDSSEVHIEHIMPKDSTQWEVDDDTHETYLWRLGNLMLLDGRINISLSNKPFSEKKDGYLKSKIEPNAKVAQLSQWGPAEIEDRQKELCEYALKIWSK